LSNYQPMAQRVWDPPLNGLSARGATFGVPIPATENVFWDTHGELSTVSLLNEPGAPAPCKSVGVPTYSCKGEKLGSYTIAKTLTSGTIDNTPVTNVSVTDTSTN
jgi:hypothetical protein